MPDNLSSAKGPPDAPQKWPLALFACNNLIWLNIEYKNELLTLEYVNRPNVIKHMGNSTENVHFHKNIKLAITQERYVLP